MSLLRPSGNWPVFAGTALAIEAVNATRAAAAEVLTVATIRHSWALAASPPTRYANPLFAGQVPAVMEGAGGTINTTFTYDAKGNMTSGNGLTIAYTPFNKPATNPRHHKHCLRPTTPSTSASASLSPSGITLYLGGGGVFAERFAGIGGGGVRWTDYLIVGGRLVGVHIQKADETTATRYFHSDHLGSISVITKEAGIGLDIVVERLSYDAWGKRRQPDGTPDPAGSITNESNRSFSLVDLSTVAATEPHDSRRARLQRGMPRRRPPCRRSSLDSQVEGWSRVSDPRRIFGRHAGSCTFAPLLLELHHCGGRVRQQVLRHVPSLPIAIKVLAAVHGRDFVQAPNDRIERSLATSLGLKARKEMVSQVRVPDPLASVLGIGGCEPGQQLLGARLGRRFFGPLVWRH
jgi:hypothetical protein